MFRKFIQNKINLLSREEIYALAVKKDAIPKTDATYINETRIRKSMGSHPESYVHIAEIIKQRAVDYTSPADREIVATFHPWQKANIVKISDHVTMETPIFAKPGYENDEEPKEDEFIASEWGRLRLQEAWNKMMKKARKHGWGLYYPLKESSLPDWWTGPPWEIYSADEAIPNKSMEKNVLGHPTEWDINPSNIYRKPFKITINECVYFDPSLSDDFDGIPEGLDIWDDLIDYVFINEAINSFDQRMGNGFMVLVVPTSTSDSEVKNAETKLKNVRTEMGMVVRSDAVDAPVTIDWMNMAGAQVDFVSHLEKIEDRFALSMGFPKRWLLGDSEGAMESSGKDALQVNIKTKVIFKQWIPFIKAVLKYHNLISDYSDIVIKPAFEMQLSEQEKISLEQIKTQTIAAKSWLTDDEKRELDGYPPMTEAQKNEKINENQFNIGFGQDKEQKEVEEKPPKDPITPSKEQTKSDSFDLLADIFTNNSISINQLADITGVSPTTISKIRSKFDADLTPHIKIDSLSIKEDSISIENNRFKIEDIKLVLPQERKYGVRTCIRTPEAILKAFNDPKTPKEYRIGVTVSDDHSSKVPLEILNENAVGRVILTRVDETGAIRGNIEGNLDEADRVLGSNNWLKNSILQQKYPSTSVALYSVDKPNGDKFIEDNLDIRSFVFTRNPRNNEAGQE